MATQTMVKKLEFVNDRFVPQAAKDVVSTVFDSHINFCKIQQMSNWERTQSWDNGPINKKCQELDTQMSELQKILDKAKKDGQEVSISGVLEVKIG